MSCMCLYHFHEIRLLFVVLIPFVVIVGAVRSANQARKKVPNQRIWHSFGTRERLSETIPGVTGLSVSLQ